MSNRMAGEDRIGPTGDGGMINATPSPQIECERNEVDGRSYGKTEIGKWLKNLLIQIGAPQQAQLDTDEVTDTGTALQVHGDAYGDELVVYVSAQKPPDPDFSSHRAESAGQFEDFVIYYQEASVWKSFTAVNNEWQLSIIGYPGPTAQAVTWTARSTAIKDWFSQALSRAKEAPPPCSFPI